VEEEGPVTDDAVTLSTVPGVSLDTQLKVLAQVDALFKESLAAIRNSKKYQTMFLYFKFLFVLFLFIIYSRKFPVPNRRRQTEDSGRNDQRCEA
jgi:hypothetical protein